jgi:endonuclease/exonuclease/phosphatase family metal-dependent hydrolase
MRTTQDTGGLWRTMLLATLAGLLMISSGCGGNSDQTPPATDANQPSVSDGQGAGQGAKPAMKPSEPTEPTTDAFPPPEVPAVVASLHRKEPGRVTGTFLDRPPKTNLRFVCWNILWNNIFVEENPQNAERFARVIHLLNPDVIAMQEFGVTSWMLRDDPDKRPWGAADVAHLMNAILPLEDGQQWHAFRGADNVIVSRYPLMETRTATEPRGDREQAIALIDLPERPLEVDLYVMNNHYKCCDPEKNDVRRQEQSDAIVNWIRDARTPGGEIDLPPETPIIVAGDLNIVGSFEPVRTLVEGDIADEDAYGADFLPDWDDSPMTDLHPKHNGTGADDYTWRDDTSQYDPGRLDYIIYTDSVMEVLNAYVLNTTTMSAEDLAATALEKLDVVVDDAGKEFDHLPLVADFRIMGRPPAE